MADAPHPRPAPNPDGALHVERSVRTGVLWKFVGQIGVQGTRFVTVAILARLLEPADYGSAAVAVALATFAPTVGDMGMGAALVQTDRATRTVRSTAFWGSLAFGASISALFVVFAVPVGRFFDDPRIGTMVAVGALTFVIYSPRFDESRHVHAVDELSHDRVALHGRPGRRQHGVDHRSGLGSRSVGLRAAAGRSDHDLRGSPLVAPRVAPDLRVLRRDVPPAEWICSSDRRRAMGAVDRAPRPVTADRKARRRGGPRSWTFAMSTVILPLVVIAIPIAEVLFSAFSRLRGDRERTATLWLDSIGLQAAVVTPLLVGLVVVAPDLIPLVFGEQWRVSVTIIQILSIYVIIEACQSLNSIVLDAAGRPHVTLWTQLAALALAPVAVIVGAQWSIEAVAVCFVVAQLIAVEIPSFAFVLSELRVAPRKVASRLAGIAAATSVMAVTCVITRLGLSALGLGMAGRAGLTIAVGVVAYPVALSFFAPETSRRAFGLLKRVLGQKTATQLG